MLNFGFNSRENYWQSSVNEFFGANPVANKYLRLSVPTENLKVRPAPLKSTVHLKIIHILISAISDLCNVRFPACMTYVA